MIEKLNDIQNFIDETWVETRVLNNCEIQSKINEIIEVINGMNSAVNKRQTCKKCGSTNL